MGSYNYLGFAQNDTDFLKTVADTTRQYGVGVSGTRQELGEWRLFSSSSACLLPFYVRKKASGFILRFKSEAKSPSPLQAPLTVWKN